MESQFTKDVLTDILLVKNEELDLAITELRQAPFCTDYSAYVNKIEVLILGLNKYKGFLESLSEGFSEESEADLPLSVGSGLKSVVHKKNKIAVMKNTRSG